MGGLLIISLLVQAFGGYGTINNDNNCYYRTYFTLRAIVEIIKLVIVIMLPAGSMILWQKVEIDNVLSIQYLEFIAFVSLSLTFTVLTTIWSTLRIRDAQSTRRRN